MTKGRIFAAMTTGSPAATTSAHLRTGPPSAGRCDGGHLGVAPWLLVSNRAAGSYRESEAKAT